MSYLVLARKWRPKRFAELVGQEHVVRALTNALDSGRVHHAFLFTGTRGVGKTTIARIFAKSLNCERGTSAEPCGECNACRDIDAGRFIDLLEIDAASNTGVDDVRDLIDNAQYMPSRGRIKVYLIDEVHMLSKSAFNALLKTLEEPPEHVKFLLATTDPQKLPVTVLSRCLQFNLKRLDVGQIEGQISKILDAEQIAAEPGAIRQIARAADGSLRDGLSLLDQAIAYSGDQLSDDSVATMLGTVDRTRVAALLAALSGGEGSALMQEISALSEFSPDWNGVLDAIASALHAIQVTQLVPDADVEAEGVPIEELAAAIQPEVVQLWYQMALNGQHDLHLAPSARAGFEMVMLRMLAFRPTATVQAQAGNAPTAKPVQAAPVQNRQSAVEAARQALFEQAPAAKKPEPAPAPVQTTSAAQTETPNAAAVVTPSNSVSSLRNTDEWIDVIAELDLRGPVRELAAHAGFIDFDGTVLQLALTQDNEHLKMPILVQQFTEALTPVLGVAPVIRFNHVNTPVQSLHLRDTQERDQRQAQAEDSFLADPQVKQLLQEGATVVPNSIRPYDD